MKYLFIYIIVIVSYVFCAPVSEGVTQQVAENTFVKYHESHNIDNFIVRSIDTIIDNDTPIIYIYHLEPQGFILISAEDKAVPVLAYGFEHNFVLTNIPDNLNYLLELYKNEIADLKQSESPRLPTIIEEWSLILQDQDLSRETRNVSPLLDAEFDQGGSWNNGIQQALSGNPLVGCVAVSMGQIMHYWSHPPQGEGSNFYYEDDYGLIEVDFGSSFYDFSNMPATYATSATQLLLYHAGVAVNMDYSSSGSGAFVTGQHPSAEHAMKSFFRYSDELYSVYKDQLGTTEFRNIIKNELDWSRPVIYSGYPSSGGAGHAWNVDGYQGNNLHCNWGWGGYSNGYYSLSSMGGFSSDQVAVINMVPESFANPMALFDYEVSDQTVVLIDLSSEINEEQIESWSWNFGDGNSIVNSYGFYEHTYEESGTYLVELTITNMYGQISEPYTESIVIQGSMPGDMNYDEVLNILDVVLLVNLVLDGDYNQSGDLNNDSVLNVLDIVLIINNILN